MKYHVKPINGPGHALRMTSVRDLREWSRGVCASYPKVDIKDMSTSFRNGLAFCAIIHKHRPDLIDFKSLSKKDIYQNNKLAFTVAETRLGVSALLDPKELVSNKVPDGLSIVSYLSLLYFYFNRKSLCAGPAGLTSSRPAVSNNPAKNKLADGSKPLKSATHLETNHFSHVRTRMVCNLCLKPVHLIQRHLIDGKFYHLSCFRCKLCHSTLLPESYQQGSDAQSLICTYHKTFTSTDSKQFIGLVESHQKRDAPTGFLSFSGLSISSVPHYTNKTTAQDEPVFETREKQWRSSKDMERQNSDSTNPFPPDSPASHGGHAMDTEAEKAALTQMDTEIEEEEVVLNQQPSVDQPPCGKVTPRDDGVVPGLSSTEVSAPGLQKKYTSAAAGYSSNHPLTPSQSQTAASSRVRPKHPWMTIIHPGPWTQLPPAAPPVAPSRVKSIYRPCGPWYRNSHVPPNPFREDELRAAKSEYQRKSKLTAVGSGMNPTRSAGHSVKPAERRLDEMKQAGETEPTGGGASGIALGSHAAADTWSVHSDCPSNVSPSQHQSMIKSQSLQTLSFNHAPTPGFPLIKRKVQSDDYGPTENLKTQMREVGERLEELQQKGVQLEKNLRECQDDVEEDRMLMDWFSLLCERQVLVRRDTELVYLTKQQSLEERQADVEFGLRCILNKPEKDWSPEDQEREQQLMDELVAIIAERDQIIGSLDLDRQREREEEGASKAFMKNKEIQEEGLKEMKKSKGKLNPNSVFKMLNHKVENIKDDGEKKS